MAVKRGFQPAACARMPKRERTEKFPRASEVKENTAYTSDAPESILKHVGHSKMVMAFKIETHGWPTDESEKGHIGYFGFYTMKDTASIAFARVVRIGWVTGENRKDAPTVSKCNIVRPDEFAIEKEEISGLVFEEMPARVPASSNRKSEGKVIAGGWNADARNITQTRNVLPGCPTTNFPLIL